MDSILPTIAIFCCAAGSFFFALAESALFSLGPWQARRLAKQSAAHGRQLEELLADSQDLLATIVLGNTMANAGMVAVGLIAARHGVWPLGWTVIGLGSLVLFLCEVWPKTLAVRSPEVWALRVSGPMGVLCRLTRPLRQIAQRFNNWLLSNLLRRSLPPQTGVSDAEYHELIEMAFQQGTLAAGEKEIILQIVRLDQRTAGDAMRPRSMMACIPDNLTIEEMLIAARKLRHRRLPMYDESPDTIVGILNTQALLMEPARDLSEVMELPSFVPASMNLLQLLRSLRRQQRGLAIVLDEYGGTAGLVTVGDILEDMVGEIRGEAEAEGFVMERLAPGRWRVNGTMRLEDFRREYPALPDWPGTETLGGLMVAAMEVVPTAGQTVWCGGLLMTAHVADERRVREILIELPAAAQGRHGARREGDSS